MSQKGMLGGVLLGVAVLIALSIMLLRTSGADERVLIAVWLWTLPVLGVGVLIGWSVDVLIRRIVAGIDATK